RCVATTSEAAARRRASATSARSTAVYASVRRASRIDCPASTDQSAERSVQASSAPADASHGHASRSAPASSLSTTASAAAQAARPPVQTQACGVKPPCESPSAGTSTSGTAAAGAGRTTQPILARYAPTRTYRRGDIDEVAAGRIVERSGREAALSREDL